MGADMHLLENDYLARSHSKRLDISDVYEASGLRIFSLIRSFYYSLQGRVAYFHGLWYSSSFWASFLT